MDDSHYRSMENKPTEFQPKLSFFWVLTRKNASNQSIKLIIGRAQPRLFMRIQIKLIKTVLAERAFIDTIIVNYINKLSVAIQYSII